MTNKEKILAAVADSLKAIGLITAIGTDKVAKEVAIQAIKDIPHLLAGVEADAYIAASMEAL